MKLEVGQTIKTNYDTGPYKIVSIERNCRCPGIMDVINDSGVIESNPHAHLIVRDLKDKKLGYLNWYDEDTLKSVVNRDRIIMLSNDRPIQLSLV